MCVCVCVMYVYMYTHHYSRRRNRRRHDHPILCLPLLHHRHSYHHYIMKLQHISIEEMFLCKETHRAIQLLLVHCIHLLHLKKKLDCETRMPVNHHAANDDK